VETKAIDRQINRDRRRKRERERERGVRVARREVGGGRRRGDENGESSSVGRVSQGSARRDGALRRPILNSSRSPHGINTTPAPASRFAAQIVSSPALALLPARRGCPASAAVGLLLLLRRESSFIPRSTHCTRVLAFLPSCSFGSFVREIDVLLSLSLSLSLFLPPILPSRPPRHAAAAGATAAAAAAATAI